MIPGFKNEGKCRPKVGIFLKTDEQIVRRNIKQGKDEHVNGTAYRDGGL